MKVLKFGGSSVSTPENISRVIDIISQSEDVRAVVVSAFGGVTDLLEEAGQAASSRESSYEITFKHISERHLLAVEKLIPAERRSAIAVEVKVLLKELEEALQGISLLGEFTARTRDSVLSFGERLSAYIISEAIKSHGIDAEYLDARNVLKTTSDFGNAVIDIDKSYSLITDHFNSHPALQIVTGFIASDSEGLTTTLGRGGSDYTAALFGAALNATQIEIWTDVDGVLSCNPRKVPEAFPVREMTFNEAMELSHFGASVLYPPTMQPAMKNAIPIVVKNTFNPSFEGTVISDQKRDREYPATGITAIEDITLVTLSGSGLVGVAGISARLFGALAKENISVILITQASSEHSICFGISPERAQEARLAIEVEFELEMAAGRVDPVKIEEGLSAVSVVGENMRRTPGIAAKCFQALARSGINVVAIAQGSSELNITVVVKKEEHVAALNLLHSEFFTIPRRILNLFIAGTGLIGSELIRQIHSQKHLLSKRGIELKVIFAANSRTSLFNRNGLKTEHLLEDLKSSNEPGGLNALKEAVECAALPASVVVDCTASEEIGRSYLDFLKKGVSVVAANKRGQSAEYSYFSECRKAARPGRSRFLYEASVGAGLPVIATLRELLATGDKIIKIEGVLSGSLSFIFNNFTADKSFSDLVKKAGKLGYLEPDPRDDLNGSDLARKCLILARECGLKVEPEQIELEPILPESCLNAPDIDTFYSELKKADPYFQNKIREHQERSEKLRYVVEVTPEHAAIKLIAVNSSHPFYALSGSDNMVSFTTERYREQPLVIRGPGAGAAVTAMGVFGDILRLI
ncbi:MAG: bifunctional aspartate kinase/homoserine dehydrogenase I [Candidatus Dadabacteria bacterium]|nr:MAG: bifunctional aspartate kinase/homoserine dehydrogenase I [Candidatus Dadabacteria bacterium]